MKKIFLTVGVQLPFDRLVKVVHCFEEVFSIRGQVGDSSLDLGDNYKQFIDENEYRENFLWADAIVAHAGMGSVLTALEYKKKIFIMPRLADFGEHRNNHQVDTVKYLKIKQESQDQDLFVVAGSPEDLYENLAEYSRSASDKKTDELDFVSRRYLIDFIKNEI